MRERHIKCPVEKKIIIKSVFCPNKECIHCLTSQDKRNRPRKSTLKRPEKPYAVPEKKRPLNDANRQILYTLDEQIKELSRNRDGDKEDLLSFKELLFDLGRKGFNLNKYYSLANRDFSQLLYFRKSWKKERERLGKAERDYKRILKILEAHEKVMRGGWTGSRNFELGGSLKEKIKEWLLSEEQLKSLYKYLKDRGVNPERESPELWDIFYRVIKFLVKDLKDIGHSENEAAKLTLTLLQKIGYVDYGTYKIITKEFKEPFPIQFKNLTHHAVRERYKYLKKIGS